MHLYLCLYIFTFWLPKAVGQHQRWEKGFWGKAWPQVFKTTLMLPEDVREREGEGIIPALGSTQWSLVIRHGPKLSQSQSGSPLSQSIKTVRGSFTFQTSQKEVLLCVFLRTDTSQQFIQECSQWLNSRLKLKIIKITRRRYGRVDVASFPDATWNRKARNVVFFDMSHVGG